MKTFKNLLLLTCLFFAGCNVVKQNTEITSLSDIDRKAEKMRESILNSVSEVKVPGKMYYVSNAGDDSNDGLSAESAIKSLDRVNALELNPGDAVMFERGGLWRGSVRTCNGVTYSAYGKGDKPNLYGSPCDAAKEGRWTVTDVPDVYVYDRELPDDIGTLVFNEGEGCAFKVMKVRMPDGTTKHVETGEIFRDYRDLKRDLDFYHDYKDAKRVYLCSKDGNPAERFKSIELNVKMNLIQAVSNVTIDNLCIKYCGAHAIGSGTVDSLRVTNCEIGWIGGSIQGDDLFGRNLPTRYGNGVEIYGGCQKYTVDNCYIYQIYDAAITHQFLGGGTNPVVMQNVAYTNNLIEDCVYSFEYFLGKADNDAARYMEHILIENNVARRTGMGWGSQRPDKETPAQVKSWVFNNEASDFIIRNNIFDRSTHDLLNIVADSAEWLPVLKGNVYVQYRNASGGKLGSNNKNGAIESDPFWGSVRNDDMRHPFNDDFEQILKTVFSEDNAKIIFVEGE